MKIRLLKIYMSLVVILATQACSDPISEGTMEEAKVFYKAGDYNKSIRIVRYLATKEKIAKLCIA